MSDPRLMRAAAAIHNRLRCKVDPPCGIPTNDDIAAAEAVLVDAAIDGVIDRFKMQHALRSLADEVDAALLSHRPQSLDLAVWRARSLCAAEQSTGDEL